MTCFRLTFKSHVWWTNLYTALHLNFGDGQCTAPPVYLIVVVLFQIAEAYSLKEDCILSSAQWPHLSSAFMTCNTCHSIVFSSWGGDWANVAHMMNKRKYKRAMSTLVSAFSSRSVMLVKQSRFGALQALPLEACAHRTKANSYLAISNLICHMFLHLSVVVSCLFICLSGTGCCPYFGSKPQRLAAL